MKFQDNVALSEPVVINSPTNCVMTYLRCQYLHPAPTSGRPTTTCERVTAVSSSPGIRVVYPASWWIETEQ